MVWLWYGIEVMLDAKEPSHPPAFCIHRPRPDAIQNEISLSWAGGFSPILFSLWQFHVITYIQDILAFAPSIVCAKYASEGKLLYYIVA
jgi:hypothetical protein